MPHFVFSATVASFATSSSAIDLGQQGYQAAFLEIPTMTSNTECYINAASTLDGTYRPIQHPLLSTSTAEAPNKFTVVSSVTNEIIPIPNGLRFVKVETSAVVSFSAAYKIHTSSL